MRIKIKPEELSKASMSLQQVFDRMKKGLSGIEFQRAANDLIDSFKSLDKVNIHPFFIDLKIFKIEKKK